MARVFYQELNAKICDQFLTIHNRPVSEKESGTATELRTISLLASRFTSFKHATSAEREIRVIGMASPSSPSETW